MTGPDLVGPRSEAVDQGVRGGAARGGGADPTKIVFPRRPRSRGEHRRGDRRQLRIHLRRQRDRAEDQIRVRRRDGIEVGGAAGADGGHAVQRAPQIRGLIGGAVRPVWQGGGDDPGLQAKRAQGVELVTGEHHDALRVGRHLGHVGGDAGGVMGRPGRRPRVGGSGVVRAGVVGLAVVSQHPGTGDLGGGGDQRPRRSGGLIGTASAARHDRHNCECGGGKPASPPAE